MKLIIDTKTNSIAGMTSDENYNVTGYVLADMPTDFDETHINDYVYSVDENGLGVLTIDPIAELSRSKVQKVRAIRAYFDGIVTGLKASVAAYEVATWDTQRTELTAYLANANNPTPYVDSLATARGETRDVLFGKIKAKVEALATLQGKQQALEKQVDAATDMGTLNAITYN
jgi:hypothetical protein